MTENRADHSFMIFSSEGDGPYQGLPQFPDPPDEGDTEWRARARIRTWYHTTPIKNLEQILRKGLKPWGAEGCVHLSVQTMEELTGMFWRVEDTVVLEVSLEGLPDEHITPGYDDMEYCLAITCVIPPENVKVAVL